MADSNYFVLRNGDGFWFSDINLELVETSEQIAVNKFKEELKEKLKVIINKRYLIGEYNPTLTEIEILKLLE